MTRYQDIEQNGQKFLSLTAYTVAEFQALLPYFVERFLAHVAVYTLEGKVRKNRRYVEYANSPLPTMEDKLLFALIYMKTNNLQTVQGELFTMHQPEACHWIHLLVPLVNQALAACGELPARTMAELEIAPGSSNVFFHDGTERPILRPTDAQMQQSYYSGKKKTHTVKNDVIGNEECKIIFLTDTVEGKKHDKKLADEADYSLPDGSVLFQDTGFQGFSLDNVTILQPKKKPRGRELSAWDKALNRTLSAIRIRIEHMINGVKRYRIVKDKIRNWKPGFRDLVLETCCGLHNFRLRFRPWRYQSIPHFQSMLKSL